MSQYQLPKKITTTLIIHLDKVTRIYVVAGLVQAVKVFVSARSKEDVDARDERGHDELNQRVI